MWFTIATLFITAGISIISLVTRETKPKWLKTASIFLTIAILALGIFSAKKEDQKARMAAAKQQKRDSIQLSALRTTQDSLNYTKRLISTINISTNDLAVLNKLTGDKTYCVVIATGKTEGELVKYRENIERMFAGAESSGLVKIRSDGHGQYELIFGSELSVAAAEIFQRLATAHHFANGFPRIEKER